MPRKPTGNPSGRPPTVRRDDGKPDPSVYKPEPTALRAIEAEVHFYKLQKEGSADEKAFPVLASAKRVARRAKVTTRAVQKWRKEPWYEYRFWAELSRRKARAKLERDLEARKPKLMDEPLAIWLAKDWPPEGVVSPINGRRYHSPETYARHLIANGVQPYDRYRWQERNPGI